MCYTPCNECPFSPKSIRGWLATYTPLQLHGLVMHEIHFPCHMTMGEKEDVSFEEAKTLPICKGSIIFMRNAGKLPRDPKLLELVKNVPDKSFDLAFKNSTQFFSHHTFTLSNANTNIMVKRADIEMEKCIVALMNQRNALPAYSFFGGSNHKKFDKMIELVKTKNTNYDSIEVNEDEFDDNGFTQEDAMEVENIIEWMKGNIELAEIVDEQFLPE